MMRHHTMRNDLRTTALEVRRLRVVDDVDDCVLHHACCGQLNHGVLNPTAIAKDPDVGAGVELAELDGISGRSGWLEVAESVGVNSKSGDEVCDPGFHEANSVDETTLISIDQLVHQSCFVRH